MDGDGWVRIPDGTRRWGLHGAAGLLVVAPADGARQVLLQLRAAWTNVGGTWGIPGGARTGGETAVEAALRETEEETGIGAASVEVVEVTVTTEYPDVWSYTTVLARAAGPLPVRLCAESVDLRWVPVDQVAAFDLMPAFRASWEEDLRARVERVDLAG